ncbi:MAG: hypothetical protein U5K81_02900 [Trueperaceae bacterium]|nr:hypothetical protein [Trueperaceae bacterium]
MTTSSYVRVAILALLMPFAFLASAQEEAPDPELVKRGQDLYYNVAGTGCVTCHGVAGLGDIGIGPNIRGVPVVRIEGALDAAEEMAFLHPVLSEDDLVALEAYLAYVETLVPATTTVRGGAFQPDEVRLPAGQQVQLIVDNGNRSPCTLVVDGVDVQATIDGRSTGDVSWTTGSAGTQTVAYCQDEPDVQLTVRIVEPEE